MAGNKEEEQTVEKTTDVSDKTPTQETKQEPTEQSFKASEVEALVKRKLDEQYRKLNKKLTELGQEKARLLSQSSQPLKTTDDSGFYENMLNVARQRSKESGETDPMIMILEQEVSRRKETARQLQYQAQLAQQEQTISDEHDRVKQKIEDAGLDPDDERFEGVHDAIDIAGMRDGKFDKAWSRFEKIMTKVNPKPKESKSKIEELEEELARLKLNKEGKAKSDTGLPSGAARGFQDIEAAYGRGELSIDEYQKARRSRGLD